ncbi:MAG: hypothetical protein IKE91_05000 [Clostridia bacterium]|nr:hypothetical protein [Clostridia bacterium]
MKFTQLSDAPELRWLKEGTIHATPEGPETEDKEYKRTWCSVELLRFVLDGNYDAFCECQSVDVRITPESFAKVREFVKSVLKNEEDEKAMAYYLIINDLGKIGDFVQKIKDELGFESVDHDMILFEGLKANPELSPSFAALDEKYRNLILAGLKANFNMGQFVQSECFPANLIPLKDVEKDALDFYLIHVLFDIAGAAGHVKSNGSLVFNEVYTNRFYWALESIRAMCDGEMTAARAYDEYLIKTMEYFGLYVSLISEESMVIAKLLNLIRVTNHDEAKQVEKAFYDLPTYTRENLAKELTATGIDDSAILLYYLPAMLQNALGYYKKIDAENAISLMLDKMATKISRLYKMIRAMIDMHKDGVRIAFIADLAAAAKNPDVTVEVWSFKRVGDDFVVTTGETSEASLTFRA